MSRKRRSAAKQKHQQRKRGGRAFRRREKKEGGIKGKKRQSPQRGALPRPHAPPLHQRPDGLSLYQMNCHSVCPYTPAGTLIIGHDCPHVTSPIFSSASSPPPTPALHLSFISEAPFNIPIIIIFDLCSRSQEEVPGKKIFPFFSSFLFSCSSAHLFFCLQIRPLNS